MKLFIIHTAHNVVIHTDNPTVNHGLWGDDLQVRVHKDDAAEAVDEVMEDIHHYWPEEFHEMVCVNEDRS